MSVGRLRFFVRWVAIVGGSSSCCWALFGIKIIVYNFVFILLDYNGFMKGAKKKGKEPVKEEKGKEVPKCIMLAAQGVRLVIEGKPNSKESKIMEINEEYMGVAIAAPAKEGEANEELVRFIAEVLGVKKNTVYLDKGCKSRHKVAIV